MVVFAEGTVRRVRHGDDGNGYVVPPLSFHLLLLLLLLLPTFSLSSQVRVKRTSPFWPLLCLSRKLICS